MWVWGVAVKAPWGRREGDVRLGHATTTHHPAAGTAAQVVTLPIIRETEGGGLQETVIQLEAWGEDGVRVRIANGTDYLVETPPIQALLPSAPTFWWWSKYTHPTTTHNLEKGAGHDHRVGAGAGAGTEAGTGVERGHDGDHGTGVHGSSGGSSGEEDGVKSVRSGNLEATVGADGLLTFRRLSDGTTILKEVGHTFGPVVAMSGASTNAGSITLARQGEVG